MKQRQIQLSRAKFDKIGLIFGSSPLAKGPPGPECSTVFLRGKVLQKQNLLG